MEKIYFIVTIDVEEDDWIDYRRSGFTTENIREIPLLHKYLDDAGIKPTYLVNHPIATDSYAIDLFKDLLQDGKCEIGTHIHPWNTPPFEEAIDERNSMLCNLPEELQYNKIREIHETIRKNIKTDPISFRAGRWAFDEVVGRNIHRLGYMVDTSVTAYVDWSCYMGPDFSDIPPDPYTFPLRDARGNRNGSLLEVPASVGYIQKNQYNCNEMYKMLKKASFEKMKVLGILNRLNILNKVWLSPEICDLHGMIRLIDRFRSDGKNVINMTLHSNSMMCGLNPFIIGKNDLNKFKDKLRDIFQYVKDNGFIAITLKDVLSLNIHTPLDNRKLSAGLDNMSGGTG